METYFEAQPALLQQSAIALGFFDGVHPGHKAVIQACVDDAKRLNIKSGVVTFKDHPRTLTRGKSPLLLTVIEQRLDLISRLNVDFALVLAFTEELCLLSPREYVEQVLVGSLGAKSISVGHNHHFGKDREGDANLLAKIGEELDYKVNVANMIRIDDIEVSSSIIRQFIEMGQMEKARHILQRPFAIRGVVAHGDGRGKQIGFPTANLDIYEYQMLPKRGVYAGKAKIKDGTILGCVINVGLRPTFKNVNGTTEPTLTIEAHLFEHDKDLYGETLEIEFLDFIRDEEKFSSKDALIEQIQRDKQKAINYLKSVGFSKVSTDHSKESEEKLHA